MIKIDASNFIPKRLGAYLLGIIPGFVFELSLAFGDPELAHRVIDRVRQIYPFQAYALLLPFVASSLIVGQTIFLLAWFAEWLIYFLYRFGRWFLFHATLGSDWLYKAIGKLQGFPPKRNVHYLWRRIMWARGKKVPFEIRPVLKCQRMAATQLLKRKYGVTPSKGQWEWVDQEWQAWLSVLGKTPARFRETILTTRTFLGCGLAELAALYICPGMRNRYFATITAVLLVAGFFQSISLCRWRLEPIRNSLSRLATVMEELAETTYPNAKESKTGDRLTAMTLGDRVSEED